jgi:hypothetical protein
LDSQQGQDVSLLHNVQIGSGAYSSTLKWRQHVPPKCWLTFNGLHGVITQKIELFITTAARTSDPTNYIMDNRT